MTESPTPKRAARSEILKRHRRRLDDWLAESGSEVLDGDAFETESNRNRLEALRHLDGSASLGEELRVRLVSPSLEEGALSFDAGSALLKPLQDSVASLGDGQVELELVGVSSGSTVLHIRPRHTVHDLDAENPRVGDRPVDSSSTESALRSFVDLVRAAEEGDDLRRWLKAADSLGRFSKALDRLDAQVDVAFAAVSGEVRSAWFGERGREYVRRLLDTEAKPTQTTISGRVVELRESGVVKVKTGTQRKAPSYEVKVESSDLLSMHLYLGQVVSFVVRIEQQVDGLGQPRSHEVHFVSTAPGFASSDSPIPTSSDDD